MELTKKESSYLKSREVFQNKLDSGGYITASSYLTRENFEEYTNLMRKSVRENKNCFERKH